MRIYKLQTAVLDEPSGAARFVSILVASALVIRAMVHLHSKLSGQTYHLLWDALKSEIALLGAASIVNHAIVALAWESVFSAPLMRLFQLLLLTTCLTLACVAGGLQHVCEKWRGQWHDACHQTQERLKAELGPLEIWAANATLLERLIDWTKRTQMHQLRMNVALLQFRAAFWHSIVPSPNIGFDEYLHKSSILVASHLICISWEVWLPLLAVFLLNLKEVTLDAQGESNDMRFVVMVLVFGWFPWFGLWVLSKLIGDAYERFVPISSSMDTGAILLLPRGLLRFKKWNRLLRILRSLVLFQVFYIPMLLLGVLFHLEEVFSSPVEVFVILGACAPSILTFLVLAQTLPKLTILRCCNPEYWSSLSDHHAEENTHASNPLRRDPDIDIGHGHGHGDPFHSLSDEHHPVAGIEELKPPQHRPHPTVPHVHLNEADQSDHHSGHPSVPHVHLGKSAEDSEPGGASHEPKAFDTIEEQIAFDRSKAQQALSHFHSAVSAEAKRAHVHPEEVGLSREVWALPPGWSPGDSVQEPKLVSWDRDMRNPEVRNPRPNGSPTRPFSDKDMEEKASLLGQRSSPDTRPPLISSQARSERTVSHQNPRSMAGLVHDDLDDLDRDDPRRSRLQQILMTDARGLLSARLRQPRSLSRNDDRDDQVSRPES